METREVDTSEATQLCTTGDITGEECPRLAWWVWYPEDDEHPVFLCNFHAEPFEPLVRKPT